MVAGDYNHPSVIMCSIGNASLALNIMASFISTGMNKGANSPKADAIVMPAINMLDIAGYNYGPGWYASTMWGLEQAPCIAVKPVNHPGVRPSKSVWRSSNAIESWAWNGCEGNKAEVEGYSDAASVELLLNGHSLNKKKTRECRAIFRTKYAPGTLTAVACGVSGKELAREPSSCAFWIDCELSAGIRRYNRSQPASMGDRCDSEPVSQQGRLGASPKQWPSVNIRFQRISLRLQYARKVHSRVLRIAAFSCGHTEFF